MEKSEKNAGKSEFERAYLGYQEYEILLTKLNKTKKEQKRMDLLYEALRKEAPYFLNLFD